MICIHQSCYGDLLSCKLEVSNSVVLDNVGFGVRAEMPPMMTPRWLGASMISCSVRVNSVSASRNAGGGMLLGFPGIPQVPLTGCYVQGNSIVTLGNQGMPLAVLSLKASYGNQFKLYRLLA
jgi:hypothetical protein